MKEHVLNRLGTRQAVWLSLWMAAFLVLVSPSAAQSTFGTIVGTVTDSTQAAIPSATVTITNLGTSEQRTAVTDARGGYSFVYLPPGSYQIEVQATGFKRYSRSPIVVEVQSALRIDPTLEVGEVTETLTVTAESPLLQTQSTTVGDVVEGRLVEDMPLNGRNPLNLIALAPGVVPQGSTSGSGLGNQAGGKYTNNTGWGNYQIGGGMGNQSAFYLDGTPLNTNNANSIGLVPVQDAIQEFRVDTNSVNPEFGRFSGGVVNMATKSGTNEYHGTAYEFLRNRALNANDFFNNRSGSPRPSFTQNQYGAALGGPIQKNKLFFFGSWEGFALRKGTPSLLTVPTAKMRQGDFSEVSQIYDPYTTCGLQGVGACPAGQETTRVPFAGNQIPQARMDHTATILQDVWGMPNLPGTSNNFNTNASLGGNQNQVTARADYSFSDNQRMFARFTYWDGNSLPFDPFKKKFGGLASLFGAKSAVVGDTYTLNPTTILDFRLSYLRSLHAFRPEQTGTDISQYGPAWADLSSQITLPVAPLPAVSGYQGFSGVFIKSTNNLYFLSGSITKILGRHSLKFGGEARRWDWIFIQSNTAAGQFRFDNVFTSANPLDPGKTGASYASYLLGTPSSGSLGAGAWTNSHQYYSGFYVSDSFRLTNKLTLNYGVRLNVMGSFSEVRDRIVVFQPDAVDPLGQQVGMDLRGQLAFVNSDAYPNHHQLGAAKVLPAPRFGIAYSPDMKTVFRAGYGISWVSAEQINYSMAPFQSPVNSTTTTMVTSNDGGLTPFNTLSNPFPDGLIQPLEHDPALLSRFEGQSFRAPIPGQPTPYIQQWNFEVQRQLAQGLALTVGYAGSKATHLSFSQLATNQLPDQYLSMGSDLLATVNNPFYGVLPTSAGQLALPTTTASQLLRPYIQYQNLNDSGNQRGNSTYNSLQVKLVKRLGEGGTFQASYTWSKLLSDTDTLTSWLEAGHPVGGVQNANDLRLEKSLASFDTPHRLVLSYVVDLPFGRGKKLLSNVHGVSDRLISGWGLNGVTTFQSGFPLALTTASNLTNSLGGGSRPNVVSSNTVISGSAQSRLGEWFNTAAFAQPAAFTFGNESRTDPNVRANGINNWDVTVFKNTALTERFNLEFRTEFFNLFNRTQFADPGTQLGNPQFGVVTSTLNQPRLVQFGLRLRF